MGKKREGYDMQQRSPAGMEQETLPLCGMYSNHSATKDTPSHLTDFKECFLSGFHRFTLSSQRNTSSLSKY